MRPLTTLAAAFGALLVAVPAWGHPGFRPDEVPAGATTEVQLAIAHGCEVPGGGTSPTTVVEVQVPESIAEVVPRERAGWTIDTTRDAAGDVRQVEWVADEATAEDEPPVFALRVTPDTQASATTVPWKVYQGCETGAYRWGVGSDDEPSVDLTVTPGTYTPPPAATPSPTVASPGTTSPGDAPSATPTANDDLSEDGPAAGSGPPWALFLLLLAAVGVGGAWWVRQRGTR